MRVFERGSVFIFFHGHRDCCGSADDHVINEKSIPVIETLPLVTYKSLELEGQNRDYI